MEEPSGCPPGWFCQERSNQDRGPREREWNVSTLQVRRGQMCVCEQIHPGRGSPWHHSLEARKALTVDAAG